MNIEHLRTRKINLDISHYEPCLNLLSIHLVASPGAHGTWSSTTVKILKIGTPEIITIIVLQLEQLDFTVQYCVQKMQTE